MKDKLKFFENALAKKRLSHLYLLSGPVGSGKLDLAFDVSSLILSEYDKRDNLLETIKSGLNSQVYHIKPDGNVIKKEQIINLQSEFSKTSLVNAPRIYIIEDVDVISTSAANSLLKFMEEPDNNNVFGLLITSNISNLLPTIISRSQVIRISGLNNTLVYDHLIKNEISEEVAINVSYLTNNYEEALEFANDNVIIEFIYFINDLILNLNNVTHSSLLLVNKHLSGILYERKYYKMFLETLLLNLLSALKYVLKEEPDIKYLKKEYKKVFNSNDEQKLIQMISLVQDEISKLSLYINIGLSLDVLLLNIKKIG